MPKALHDALEEVATGKGYTGKRKNRFVYGTMRNMEKRRDSNFSTIANKNTRSRDRSRDVVPSVLRSAMQALRRTRDARGQR